ncbi:MAG: rRNA maturation RNase YbeY [Mycoplasma sp.]
MIEFNNYIDSFEFDFKIEDYFKKINKITRKKIKTKDKRSLVVNIVDMNEIREINSKYRNKNSTTDVITFCFDESMPNSPILGEMYICLEKAQEQAIEYNHSFMREICFLFVHGLLHLFGYDHMNDEDEKIMINLQNEILNEMKLMRVKND